MFCLVSPCSLIRRNYLTTCAGVTAGRHNGSRHVTATRGLNRPSAPELRSRVVVRRDTHDPRYARDSTRVADVSWKESSRLEGGKERGETRVEPRRGS